MSDQLIEVLARAYYAGGPTMSMMIIWSLAGAMQDVKNGATAIDRGATLWIMVGFETGSYEGDPKKAEALPTSASQSILTAVKACECIRQCVMRRYSDTSIVSNIFDVQMVSGATLPAFNVLRGAEAKRGGTWLSKTKVLRD